MQKIITTHVDLMDGEAAMQQIQRAAGPGEWRILSLIDLHWLKKEKQTSPGNPGPYEGEPVMVVVERTDG